MLNLIFQLLQKYYLKQGIRKVKKHLIFFLGRVFNQYDWNYIIIFVFGLLHLNNLSPKELTN